MVTVAAVSLDEELSVGAEASELDSVGALSELESVGAGSSLLYSVGAGSV